jgi:hypothetical protein
MICCHLWYYSELANVIDLFRFEQSIKSLAACPSDIHIAAVDTLWW